MNRIPEADWKQLRKLEKAKLALACANALETLRQIIDASADDPHAAYQKLYKATRDEDKKIAFMFDDLGRGGAVLNLANWYRYGILSDEELELFTPKTREQILFFNK